MENVPRPATAEELKELLRHSIGLLNAGPHPDEETLESQVGFVERACVAVFDHYRSGGPGYCGKVMTVIWEASPDSVRSYIWVDGQMYLSDEDEDEDVEYDDEYEDDEE